VFIRDRGLVGTLHVQSFPALRALLVGGQMPTDVITIGVGYHPRSKMAEFPPSIIDGFGR
jgi:hypothetical protein